MHDPKLSEKEVQRFELEVQQKMEELEFSPSAAVWATIEKAVRVEKKRRVPFFWLFFLPGILLIGGAGIYLMGSRTSASSLHTDNSNPGNHQPISGQPLDAHQTSGDLQPSNDHQPSDGYQRSNDQPSTAQAEKPDPSVTVPSEKSGRSAAIHQFVTADQPSTVLPEKIDRSAKSAPSTKKDRAASITNTSTTIATATPGHTHAPSRHKAGTTGKTISQPLTAQSTTARPLTTQSLTDQPLTEEQASGFPSWTTIHLNPVNQKNIAAIQAAPLAKKPALTTRLTPKRTWEAGFTGGIGISALNQGVFKGSAVTANDTRNFSAPLPVTGSTTKNYVSKIRPDLSFWAGIFLQKPILNDVSVSVGLNLHYYSTKVYTGDKVINNASNYYYSPAASLLSIAAAPTPAQSYPYYAAGDNETFINRYYFLEIPGSIRWQINHNRIMPLFWEVGGTLSYMMGSNAIYYNTKAGVYYKDANVSNKTQLNLSTALMVGIPFKGLQMQVGPQLQYGVTRLLNTQTAGGQHLFYGGLKLVVFPGKPHKSK